MSRLRDTRQVVATRSLFRGAASSCLAFVSLTAQPAAAQQPAVVPSDQTAVLEAADRSRSRGAENAPIRIVEISDFECPFCAQFYHDTYRVVDSLYVQSGIARYLWISFPNSRHPRAWPAIESAFCAGAAGKFWEMHDALFERQDEWMAAGDLNATLVQYAVGIGIEESSFRECLRNDVTAPLQVSD
ncbi:MAG: DsbA family protein, partial [Gemmatimonadota bacterium]|nr:DsbA family protein [Gemmatimonadota bacterium]